MSFPPKKSESSGVAFRRLPHNEYLATCKFALHAADAFPFRSIAEIEDDRGIINAICVKNLILETTFLALGEKKNYM